MEEITVRLMTTEDILRVNEIENLSFSVPWSVRAFEDSLKLEHAIFLVAVVRNIIVGYVGMYQVFNEGDITNVAVHPDFRGQGVGKRLLQGLQEKALERNITELTLEVRESNETAIRLYHHFGFEDVGIRKNFYERPKENAIVMWKRNIGK